MNQPATVLLALLIGAALTAVVAPAAQERTTREPGKAPAKASAQTPSPAPGRPTAAAGARSGEAERQRQLQAEQRQLQARLGALKKQLAAAEASHSEAADALRDSEAAISAANRRLRELAQARAGVEKQIAALQERSRATSARQSEVEQQLEQVLRLQYVVARAEPWQELLAGRSPQAAAREAIYLDYVVRERTALIDTLAERRTELALLEDESRARQAELAAIAGDEETQRRLLLQQQAARKAALDRLARRIGEQRQSIAGLERDEKRLGSLIDELAKVLAEQARERERRQRAAAAAAPPARAATPRGPERSAERSAERSPDSRPTDREAPAAADALPTSGAFAQLRGKLAPPVQGEVTARFGSPRRTEAGVNAPTWKGVFIRAAAGQEVVAVAAGRVVFADWLRGFGNLAIVDHGEGFLSVYGNNESVLAAVGARVAAGEAIATVGSTGGASEPGLYFELRHQGRPFDPLRWIAAR
ncbi:MAG: peptidoglycan DD-metalloendopeptidase family protein [Burkholderiales bacterium]|nr:peptidoglycan DD-metalloendopeptidase family protein [Burkholderiales bacterium]